MPNSSDSSNLNIPSLQDVLDAVRKNGNDLNEFKTEANNHYQHITGEIKNIKLNNNANEARIGECETACDHLSYEVECLKQKQLKCNISIAGIPHHKDENLLVIFESLCTVIGFTYVRDDIAAIYRTSGTNKKSIIVQFVNDDKKFELLNAKKIKQAVIFDELNLKYIASTQEIIVAQQLTPFFANLLYNARQARQRNEIAQCWFTNKGVHIRPQENSNAVLIKSLNELSTFANKQTDSSSQNKRKASQDIANNLNKKPADISSRGNNSATNSPAQSANNSTKKK